MGPSQCESSSQSFHWAAQSPSRPLLQSCSFQDGIPPGSTQESGVSGVVSEGSSKGEQGFNNDPGTVPTGVYMFPV